MHEIFYISITIISLIITIITWIAKLRWSREFILTKDAHIKKLNDQIDFINNTSKGELFEVINKKDELIELTLQENATQIVKYQKEIECLSEQLKTTSVELTTLKKERESIQIKLKTEYNEKLKIELQKYEREILELKKENKSTEYEYNTTKVEATNLEIKYYQLSQLAYDTKESFKTFNVPIFHETEELLAKIPSNYKELISVKKIKQQFDRLDSGHYVLLTLVKSLNGMSFSQMRHIIILFNSEKPKIMQSVIVSVKKHQTIIRYLKDYLYEYRFCKSM